MRYELIGLFILSLMALAAFYYQDALPDNFLIISSQQATTNVVGYCFFSVIACAGYFVGPWIAADLILFSVAYAWRFNRHPRKRDLLHILWPTVMLLGLTYFFAPVFLGDGLKLLLKQYVEGWVLALLTLGATIGFVGWTMPRRFWAFLWKGLQRVFVLPKAWYGQKNLQFFKRVGKALQNIKHRFTTKAKRQVETFLNGESKYLALPPGQTSEEVLAASSEIDTETSEEEEAEVEDDEEEEGEDGEEDEEAEDEESDDETEEDDEESDEEAEDDGEDEEEEEGDEGPEESVAPRKAKSTQIGDEQDYFKKVDCVRFGLPRTPVPHPDDDYFALIIQRIEEKLGEFHVDGKIINVLKGPVVDTFELELGAGIKVSRVTAAQEDLSLALYGAPIRIVYPMKNRHTVGIEVPRTPREIIYLAEIIAAEEFQKSRAILPVAMGKDAFGMPYIVDLAAMPHMLVAGFTGSGKSVFINTVLVSLLARKSPRQMKLLLIDPKQLELSLYGQLPHLFVPVVTDAKVAALSLQWAVNEMERRYSILREFQVRNLESYNQKLANASPEMIENIAPYFDDSEDTYTLPYIVIIIDEFADLILSKHGKEIEYNVCRLAAKARAAGLHLIVATQRPSVDVITGLIKSNFPTRVSFKVSSAIDSRTILNAMGAEKLLGKGDMLFKNGVEMVRVHSAYIEEAEIEQLNQQLKDVKPHFNQKVLDFFAREGREAQEKAEEKSYNSFFEPHDDSEDDEDRLYEQAVAVVHEYRMASASMLQRRLRIGYNRAANLIDLMEERGVVGPAQGPRPRQVLGVGNDSTPESP